MVGKFKFAALAGALMMAASPAFAQDPLDDMMKGLGDLDPMKMMSPEPAPAAAPMEKPMKKKMMMKKKMGGKKMMMKKKMMKKKM